MTKVPSAPVGASAADVFAYTLVTVLLVDVYVAEVRVLVLIAVSYSIAIPTDISVPSTVFVNEVALTIPAGRVTGAPPGRPPPDPALWLGELAAVAEAEHPAATRRMEAPAPASSMRREAREREGLSGTEEELSMRTILTAPTVPILWPAFVPPLGWRVRDAAVQHPGRWLTMERPRYP
jgi:hypothetical protein